MNKYNFSYFGNVTSVYLSYSKDKEIRYRASSGGFVKSVLVYLIESCNVNYVIITRTGGEDNPFKNEVIITDNKNEIISSRTNSVYAPTNPFAIFKELKNDKIYAFVGLPCHVKKLREMQSNGIFLNIKYVISLFCSYTPNIDFTYRNIKKLNVDIKYIKGIEYRGHGWPGSFTVYLKDGTKKHLYEYWEDDITSSLQKCRYCVDFGAEADITVGDPWNCRLQNSDPGKSLVICRNTESDNLVKNAENAEYIVINPIPKKKILQSQIGHINYKLTRSGLPTFNYPLINKLQFSFSHPIRVMQYLADMTCLSILTPWHFYSIIYLLCKNILLKPILKSIMTPIYIKRPLIWYQQEEETKVNLGDMIPDRLMKRFGYSTTRYCIARELGIIDKFPFLLEMVGSGFIKWQRTIRPCNQLYIWGLGNGYNEIQEYDKEKVKVLAVRGPRTARMAGLDNVVICDPGFLVPYFFPFERNKKIGVLYVAHITHQKNMKVKMKQIGADKCINIVIPRSKFEKTLKKIVSAEFVLTGSLHTAILCHGYGVPWSLCLTGNDKLNLPPKWWDLFEFFGVNPDPEKHIVHNIAEGRKWWSETGSKIEKSDVLPLIQSFPLPIKDEFSMEVIKRIKSI